MTDTTARCWGYNFFGQLGANNSSLQSLVPVTVVDPANTTQPLTGIASISVGGDLHTCALMIDGTARCWGRNAFGELGNNTTTISSVPVAVVDPSNTAQALSGIVSISAGGNHTCAQMADGTARCWGVNDFGQLGNNATTGSSVPVTVVDPADTTQALTGIASISAGYVHSCAVMTDSTVRCWGNSQFGQLGNNSVLSSSVPATVVDPANTTQALAGVAGISAGGKHTCAQMTDDTARCWGNNSNGQLGNNSVAQSAVPVTVVDPADTTQALVGVSSVSAGGYHSCAGVTGGTALCWGYNANGQLGNNSVVQSLVPVAVADPAATTQSLSAIASISAGGDATCAQMTDATVRCWGYNNFGGIGDNSVVSSSVPVVVIGIP